MKINLIIAGSQLKTSKTLIVTDPSAANDDDDEDVRMMILMIIPFQCIEFVFLYDKSIIHHRVYSMV